MAEDTNNVCGNPNTNYAADKLRARHDFPAFTPRSLGHRMCSKRHCGRVPRETFRHGRERPSTSGQGGKGSRGGGHPDLCEGAGSQADGQSRWSRSHLPQNLPERFHHLTLTLLSASTHLPAGF